MHGSVISALDSLKVKFVPRLGFCRGAENSHPGAGHTEGRASGWEGSVLSCQPGGPNSLEGRLCFYINRKYYYYYYHILTLYASQTRESSVLHLFPWAFGGMGKNETFRLLSDGASKNNEILQWLSILFFFIIIIIILLE